MQILSLATCERLHREKHIPGIIFPAGILVLCLWIFSSCQTRTQNLSSSQDSIADTLEIHYAKGFTAIRHTQWLEITIRNPWDTLRVLQKYLLVDRNVPVPEGLPEGILLRTPLQSMACLYSVHAGMLHRLGRLSLLKAVAEPQFIFQPDISRDIREGKIISLGESVALDIEKLMSVKPEAVLVSPFENAGYGPLAKTGIPLIECTDYLENHPLGRAEWIKLIGWITDREEEAVKLFEQTARRYETIQDLARTTTRRPSIFSELKTGQIWYVPGGKSYMGQLFKDAGIHYLWEETSATGSIPLAYESVFEKAAEADFWMIKYASAMENMNYRTLESAFPGYAYFKAFRNRTVIACNTATNNYYEEGTLEPDVLLADLVNLIHPGLLGEHTQKYFQWMEP